MKIPKHIGIIPDGNRRWASDNGYEKKDGYSHGLEPGLILLRQAKKHGINEITFYGFTADNCKRPKEQFKAFQKACVDAVELIANEDVSLRVIGNTKSSCFPKELLKYAKSRTEGTDKIKVNFLVNYDWKWDVESLKTEGKIHSADISRVDLIIRWGGMRRLSGFLPIQSVYADFYVEDTFWPDLEEQHFENALSWYSKQDVTLGG